MIHLIARKTGYLFRYGKISAEVSILFLYYIIIDDIKSSDFYTIEMLEFLFDVYMHCKG